VPDKGGNLGLRDEIQAEQSHVDRAYRRLDALREGASELASELLAEGRGGLVADRVERDARVEHGLRRRAALSIGDRALCFGRLDYTAGDRFHIGRLGVLDADGEPLVIDWRTRAAEPFYRATSGDRRGVDRRRHILMKQRRVVGLDDELLVRGDAGASGDTLCGEGALLAALAAARTGRMGDIVATIQGEQDAAIRSPLRGILVVQGGPGTGKTAVALHRAAYLLYAHHFPLASQGVLVVGPNPVFCRYIEDVLPGLGETGVVVTTAGLLHRSYRPGAEDPPGAAAIKAGLAMVDALAATIAGHEQALEADRLIGHGIHRLPVTVADSEAFVATARAAGSHRAGRAVVERVVLVHLVRQARRAARRAVRTGLATGAVSGTDASQALEALRRSSEVRELVDRIWPALGAEQVVSEALESAGAPALDLERLTEHDVALLDEAEHLLGKVPARRRPSGRRVPRPDPTREATMAGMGLIPDCPNCGFELNLAGRNFECEACRRVFDAVKLIGPERFQQIQEVGARVERTYSDRSEAQEQVTFGHIIVDEAQDLTPMQWRMLSRRGPTGSMTIVGDLGQAKHPWSLTDWEEACAIAAPGRSAQVLELTVNYRTPSEVMDLAGAVLAEHDPAARAPTSVRLSGEQPEVVEMDESVDSTAFIAQVAAREVGEVSPGKVAIMYPVGRVPPPSPAALDLDVIEMDPVSAKGLEFDSVVVIEPAQHSLPELYVALTRTTRRLVLVTSAPLPPALIAVPTAD
jgi:hypothetical protein